MSLKADEDEHSIEMHLPYVAKVMESQLGNFTIVPILVGSLSTESEKLYGKLLAKYLADSDNVFVISSDFCHWGSRFHYTFYDKSWGDHIYESIDKLDKMGMDIIETICPSDFSTYLKKVWKHHLWSTSHRCAFECEFLGESLKISCFFVN